MGNLVCCPDTGVLPVASVESVDKKLMMARQGLGPASTSRDGEAARAPDLLRGGHTFVISVTKAPDESLGMDVKHANGIEEAQNPPLLKVVGIVPDGLVHRENQRLFRRNPAADQMRVGDIIYRVNDACLSDMHLVAECQCKSNLTFHVYRPDPNGPQVEFEA